MAPERRAQLQAKWAAATDQAEPSASRMSVLCALAVSQLSLAGAGATVLSHLNGDGDRKGPRRGLVHATNEVSAGLEDLQLTVGEGPCLDAFASGGPVLIAELAAETARWPGFTPGALELGAAALFSFPLQIGVVRLGSLDFYREQAGPLSQEQLSDALILADLATQVIMEELEGHATEDLGWLADPHAQVHQATGMARVQLGVGPETALLRLRGYAYIHELPLADVANQVVTRQLRFAPDPDPDPDDAENAPA